MTSKNIVVGMIVALLLATITSTICFDEADSAPIEIGEEVQIDYVPLEHTYMGIDSYIVQQPNKAYDIIVLGGAESATTMAASVGATTTPQYTAVDNDRKNAIVMTAEWALDNTDIAADTIEEVVRNGDTMTVIGQNVDWASVDIPMIRALNANITNVCMTENGYGYYSVSCDSDTEAMNRTLAWIDSKIGSDVATQSNIPSGPLGTEYQSFHEFESRGYGWTAIRTMYYKLEDSSSTQDYYAGHYLASMTPDSGSYNSGLDVKSESNGTMIRYGPYSTQGQSSVSVNVGASVGTDGVNFNIGSQWSYSIPDVIVMDHTNVINNVLDIRHNIDEGKNIGTTTCTVEPGKLISVSEGTAYQGVDTYKAQFCHKSFNHYVAFNDNSQQFAVNIF